MRVPTLTASQHRATRLTPPLFFKPHIIYPRGEKKIDVTYKIGKIAIINPIFYASGLFMPAANSPASAANPIKVFRGAPRRRAGAARLSWSNGATARPLAAPQPRGASPSRPAERGPRGPGAPRPRRAVRSEKSEKEESWLLPLHRSALKALSAMRKPHHPVTLLAIEETKWGCFWKPLLFQIPRLNNWSFCSGGGRPEL